MRRSPVALTLYAVVGALLVGASVALVVVGQTVTVTVDGKTDQVSSFADDVGGVLEASGIEYGPRDRVTPAPGKLVGDDTHVVVTHARKLALSVDGKTSTKWVTANTVGQALQQLGVNARGAALSAPRSHSLPLSGAALGLRTPRTITVETGAGTFERATTAKTVRQALASSGIALGPHDRVNADLGAPVKPGQVIEITPVVRAPETKTKSIGYETVRKTADKLPEGETKVVQDGRKGAKKVTVATVVEDGEKVKKILDKQVTRKAVNRIVKEGTQAEAGQAPTVGSANGLNWAALAECESSGDPNAVNSAGPYYGLYQFNVQTWQANGGEGIPSDASAAQQTDVAQRLYEQRGDAPWPVCGENLYE